ncbi:MAG: TrkA family potassium uptake protein [Acholeplasmataceae bacterium]|nr:TrkA family potassium uptake protein [Acholeplasmataceae bacterium]
MKIIIANGTHEADFIVRKFKKEKHQITIINSDKNFGDYMSSSNHIPVLCGDPTKAYVLEDADVWNADVFIALSINDIDNYVACITAKKLFNIKRVVSVVRNPKRVDLFKTLGIDSVICSTYLLGESIKNESIIEDFIKTISIENEKIVISEILIDTEYLLANKLIKNAAIPSYLNISCIYREPEVIIANGDTLILPEDKLVIATTPDNHQNAVDFIQRRVTHNGS